VETTSAPWRKGFGIGVLCFINKKMAEFVVDRCSLVR
jgi:hypothetical protein